MFAFFDRSFGFSVNSIMPRPAFARADAVDLDRYMRDWYVIAHKPPSITRTAHDSIERYRRRGDDRVAVTFTYRQDGFDGPQKTLHPTAFVVPDTRNTVWAMQFVWPVKMQFVITYVGDDYRTTIVARERLDFVWIMASEPQIDRETYDDLVARVVHMGYERSALRDVPQRPPADRDDRDD